MPKKGISWIMSLALVLCLLPALPAAAVEDTQPLENGTYAVYSALGSDMLMDVSGNSGANSANVYLWTDADATNQRWVLTHVGDGYYRIQALHSGKALDVSGGSLDSGANVLQYEYHGGDNQLWQFVSAGSGYYYIDNKNSGKYLDVSGGKRANGTNIQVYDGNGTAAQKWRVTPLNEANPALRETLDCTKMEVSAVTGGGGIQWVKSTRTLILNSADFAVDNPYSVLSGSVHSEFSPRGVYNGIKLPDGSTIVLTGENNIYGYTNGIYCEGDLEIVAADLRIPEDASRLTDGGKATLNVSGEKLAIKCDGELNIGGAELLTGKTTGGATAASRYDGEKAAVITAQAKAVIQASSGRITIGSTGVTLARGAGESFYAFAGDYVLTGRTDVGDYGVAVQSGADVTIFIQDLSIDLEPYNYKCAFSIEPGARVNMVIKGENRFVSSTERAGLEVPGGASFVSSEEGTGTLYVTGGAYGAGLGGACRDTCGSIEIRGGTIIAQGSGGGAGVGTGRGGMDGDIQIVGGTVSATGGMNAAAIGGGYESRNIGVRISGGELYARGGLGAPGIGAGMNNKNVNTTISGGTVSATGGAGSGAIGAGGGSTDSGASISGGDLTVAGGTGSAALGDADAGEGAAATVQITGGSIQAAPGVGTDALAGTAAGEGGSLLGADVSQTGGSVTETARFELPEIAPEKDRSEKLDTGGLEDYMLEADELEQKRQEAAASQAEQDRLDSLQAGDVPDDSWYADAVDFVLQNGLVDLDSSGNFDPDGIATREALVAAMYRLSGEEAGEAQRYSDVDYTGKNAAAILWGTRTGVIEGYGDSRFGPQDHITREQAGAIFVRYSDHMGIKLPSATTRDFFVDDGEISAWAYDAVYICRKAELVEGYEDGTFQPGGSITRAELAMMIYRFATGYAGR